MSRRYIDAELIPALFDEEYKKTRELIYQGETHLDNLAEGFTEATHVIRKMPSADVVEVVRCKDCRYCEEAHYEEEGEEPYIKLKCKWSNYSHQPNDYCSYAERKDENEG